MYDINDYVLAPVLDITLHLISIADSSATNQICNNQLKLSYNHSKENAQVYTDHQREAKIENKVTQAVQNTSTTIAHRNQSPVLDLDLNQYTIQVIEYIKGYIGNE